MPFCLVMILLSFSMVFALLRVPCALRSPLTQAADPYARTRGLLPSPFSPGNVVVDCLPDHLAHAACLAVTELLDAVALERVHLVSIELERITSYGPSGIAVNARTDCGRWWGRGKWSVLRRFPSFRGW